MIWGSSLYLYRYLPHCSGSSDWRSSISCWGASKYLKLAMTLSDQPSRLNSACISAPGITPQSQQIPLSLQDCVCWSYRCNSSRYHVAAGKVWAAFSALLHQDCPGYLTWNGPRRPRPMQFVEPSDHDIDHHFQHAAWCSKVVNFKLMGRESRAATARTRL